MIIKKLNLMKYLIKEVINEFKRKENIKYKKKKDYLFNLEIINLFNEAKNIN